MALAFNGNLATRYFVCNVIIRRFENAQLAADFSNPDLRLFRVLFSSSEVRFLREERREDECLNVLIELIVTPIDHVRECYVCCHVVFRFSDVLSFGLISGPFFLFRQPSCKDASNIRPSLQVSLYNK